MVSVWPVGFAGGRTFEGPQINAQGKVSGWMTAFAPDRQFPIDMAGFAINLQLLIRKSEVIFNLRNVSSGHQESGLLSRLVSVKDLEPKADNCTKVVGSGGSSSGCWFDPRAPPPPSVGVSLSKAPHPNCSRRADCHPAWLTPPSVCECVYEWVIEAIL